MKWLKWILYIFELWSKTVETFGNHKQKLKIVVPGKWKNRVK